MKVFYIRKSEFLSEISRDELEKVSDGRKYKCEEKYIEHLCGLYLIKYIAERYYNLSDTEIILNDKKPVFKNKDLYFSLSHSKDIVLVVFGNNNLGADVEYMTERDFAKILTHYHKSLENPTKESFYRFWTKYEAQIKLGVEPKSYFSCSLENEYMLTVVSDECMVSDFEIIKL